MFRSRSRANVAAAPASEEMRGRRARSKSRPRVLYAPEGEIVRNSGNNGNFMQVIPSKLSYIFNENPAVLYLYHGFTMTALASDSVLR